MLHVDFQQHFAFTTIFPNLSTERTSCTVNAYYDSLKIFLSCEEVEKQDEQPPAEWWKYIPNHIRVWRRIDFKSRKVRHKVGITKY